jgi:1,4-alpha-glucan branching enzyme
MHAQTVADEEHPQGRFTEAERRRLEQKINVLEMQVGKWRRENTWRGSEVLDRDCDCTVGIIQVAT